MKLKPFSEMAVMLPSEISITLNLIHSNQIQIKGPHTIDNNFVENPWSDNHFVGHTDFNAQRSKVVDVQRFSVFGNGKKIIIR